MTAKELIDALSKSDPDSEVLFLVGSEAIAFASVEQDSPDDPAFLIRVPDYEHVIRISKEPGPLNSENAPGFTEAEYAEMNEQFEWELDRMCLSPEDDLGEAIQDFLRRFGTTVKSGISQ